MKNIVLLIAFLFGTSYMFGQKIYSTDYPYQADVKVFVVDQEYKAGWKKNSKKGLLY